MIHVSAEVPEKPRARRRKATLRRILDAAFELVAEGGIGALSMARLADKVDFTPGALYRYYRSKDAILAALVTEIIDELRLSIVEARTDIDDPLERIVVTAATYRRFAKDQPHRFGLLAMLMAAADRQLPGEEDAHPVMTSMIRAMQPMGADFAEAATTGALEPGDAVERTVVMFAAIQGVLQLHKQAQIAPELINIDKMFDAAVKTLLRGWGAK